MLLDFTIVIGSAGISYFLIHQYKKRKKNPSLRHVLQILGKLKTSVHIAESASESDVEAILAHHLGRFFDTIQTQYHLGGIKGAKDRIDIDIDNGKFGIEIKLAPLLKKSNERNRLLGQVDLYQTRKYHMNNLLVVLVGHEKYRGQAVMKELFEILNNKGVPCFYWEV